MPKPPNLGTIITIIKKVITSVLRKPTAPNVIKPDQRIKDMIEEWYLWTPGSHPQPHLTWEDMHRTGPSRRSYPNIDPPL